MTYCYLASYDNKHSPACLDRVAFSHMCASPDGVQVLVMTWDYVDDPFMSLKTADEAQVIVDTWWEEAGSPTVTDKDGVVTNSKISVSNYA